MFSLFHAQINLIAFFIFDTNLPTYNKCSLKREIQNFIPLEKRITFFLERVVFVNVNVFFVKVFLSLFYNQRILSVSHTFWKYEKKMKIQESKR